MGNYLTHTSHWRVYVTGPDGSTAVDGIFSDISYWKTLDGGNYGIGIYPYSKSLNFPVFVGLTTLVCIGYLKMRKRKKMTKKNKSLSINLYLEKSTI